MAPAGDVIDNSALRRLSFGYEDAERDIAGGLLRASFIETLAYDAAVSGRKMLIIGRKGSGKSAICMRIAAERQDANDAILITPDDALGSEIRRFELQGLTGDTAKSLAWRYMFAIHAARYLVTHADPGRRFGGHKTVKSLRRFLKANGEMPSQDSGGRLSQSVRGLQQTSLSLEAFGFRAGVELAGGASEGAQATRQLEIVERGVADAFTELGVDAQRVPLLLIDQLEQVWSSEPDAHSMIIGLLLAAKHVTAFYGGALRCLIFLRADIYDSLSFPDGDKFRGDELRLGWSNDSLTSLALSRARASVAADLTPAQLWTELFPRQVCGVPTTEYLLPRVLPRPRDIIQYLNLSRDLAVHNRHDRIREEDVVQATRQFSEWKLKDLTQEYLVAYPYLERLFPLFQNMGYIVMRDVLADRLAQTESTLHGQFPAFAHALTVPAVIDTLYSVGFMGVRRGGDVVYAGGPELSVQPYESEFHVHPCFREALGATKAVDLHTYTPQVLDAIVSQVAGGYAPSPDQVSGFARREYSLLNGLARSCQSILDQVGRAADLPPDTRHELATQVGRIMSDGKQAATLLDQGRYIDVDDHVVAAATYLRAMAAQLRASGMSGMTGTDSVTARITEEARRLTSLVGGYTGGSGSSGSG
ncbi:P-loop ATPase, Sll1717 family [Stackebrandtia nassauensis]|uniref:Uncharacterized protein n=1 Tax=Stackebrandtia nassauensis (strain DSM 44728 / CIP 108903 / NRRL B-16338 / NBRC 102104 / LLR-40K-21) TaxID=446470 RepID=D3Q033_STANL|nr:hypothetical protein [Stackebrandtia nassauensis]ADD45562.1 hypothetical protein Snas_5935 [Stackebrandtia nassauensis DSM 44728]